MNNTSPTLHIFRTGCQTAMSGEVLAFSEPDLLATARAYDPTKHEAPIVIGHPRHDAPAFGWVKSLAATGNGLEAEPHQVDPAFAELVGQGRYKKISASFYLPDSPNNPVPGVYYLRHVGFLGALPPSVKGLREVSFNETEEGIVEFADWEAEVQASLWRRVRDWLLAQFGQEVADKVVPDWEIESMRSAVHAREASATAFAEPGHAPAVATTAEIQLKEESHVTPKEKAALEAENQRLSTENTTLHQQLADAAAREKAAIAHQQHEKNVSFAEELIAEGKLLPKHQALVVAVMDFAESDLTVQFGEGESAQPVCEAFKLFLADLPKVVDFGETATKAKAAQTDTLDNDTLHYGENVDQERLSLDRQIRQYMKDAGVDYRTAAAHVIKS
ncbi:MAG: peptidase [Burkholderiaceae bacterium]|jgi:hypothetical protein|nr:peptidase [Burkholderiaceae bacterium]